MPLSINSIWLLGPCKPLRLEGFSGSLCPPATRPPGSVSTPGSSWPFPTTHFCPCWNLISHPSGSHCNIHFPTTHRQFLDTKSIVSGKHVFPGSSAIKNPPVNVGNVGSIPGSGRSPGEGKGNPLQYSCLQNPMGRGAWQATVHAVAKSWTQLSD